MAKKTLEDLKELFKEEPFKNKRVAGQKEKVRVIDWNLDSRNLMINLFFNVLKEKHHTAKDKLPKIDAMALSKMTHPIAGELIKFRSNKKTLDSFKNVSSYINSSENYINETDVITPVDKATLLFNVLGYDNVERIFTVAAKSIPINTDKRARNAFIVPSSKISAKELDDETLSILSQIK